jgi:hypothetical protein
VLVLASFAAISSFPGCAGTSSGPANTAGLEPGAGSGYLTSTPALLRPLMPSVTVKAILTVGDTLFPARPEDELYVFYPSPDGLGARGAGSGLVEMYVAHQIGWETGVTGGARVSRILLNQRTGGVLNADYLLDGDEYYTGLASATLAGPRDGFLSPTLLINEETTLGPRHGVVGAVDIRNGNVTELPWLGRFQHESTITFRHSSGDFVTITTEDGPPAESQLYMFLSQSDSDLLVGRGRLLVFRADAPAFGPNTRYSSMVTATQPLTGRFVPCDNPNELPLARQPAVLESRAQSAGCLNFVRLEDVDVDRERSDAFYFADTGNNQVSDPVTGRPITGNGRLYRMTLDAIDPTKVTRLEVVLDGDTGDDIFRPDNIATDEQGVMIQEDPDTRGLHPARILRYDTLSRRLDPVAVCIERDTRGRTLPEGTGGEWESTGIVNVSDLFGEATWLVAVRAPTDWSTSFGSLAGGGQLLLLRWPRRGGS